MGLDISAYETARHEPGMTADAAEKYDWVWRLYNDDSFADRGDGLADGFYKLAGDELHFRAGSYSGYNNWREKLCAVALDATTITVWHAAPAFAGRPFVELVNFTDCDGFTGPKTSEKLARDFESWAGKVPALGVEFLRLYRLFQTAFEIAAGGGVVRFH